MSCLALCFTIFCCFSIFFSYYQERETEKSSFCLACVLYRLASEEVTGSGFAVSSVFTSFSSSCYLKLLFFYICLVASVSTVNLTLWICHSNVMPMTLFRGGNRPYYSRMSLYHQVFQSFNGPEVFLKLWGIFQIFAYIGFISWIQQPYF